MRAIRAFGWMPVLLLLGPAWAAAGSAATRIDAIYVELGRGEASALADSAELVAKTPPGDRARADVLALRLDVLAQMQQVNQPAGAELKALLEADAAKSGRRVLPERFAIAQAYESGNAEAALKQAEAALAAAPKDQVPELEIWYARIAANGGHLPQAREKALAALAAWHPRAGVAARWREVELQYIVGEVAAYTGSDEDALRALREGSAIATRVFGADALNRFKIDAVMAGVYTDLGRHRDALEVRQTTLKLAAQRYGEKSLEVAKAESKIGASYQEIGDYPSSRAHYERALELLAALPGVSGQERGVISVNYGNLLQETGELEASLKQYRSALELIGEKPETRHARAIVYSDMGNSKLRMQHFEDAIADYKVAIELREASDGKDNPGLVYALEGMGSANLALKRGAEAEADYRRALTLRERAFSPNHPSVAPIRFGLAVARWLQGDLDEAFKLAQQTAEHQQALLGTFAADFSERQSVAYRSLLTPATALAVTLAAERGDDASIAQAWRLTMIERGLLARNEAHRLAAARAAHDPKIAPAFDAWRKANSALGDAWLGSHQDAEQMKTLTAAAEDAERALWQATGQREQAHAAPPDPAELAHALPPDGLLIAYSDGVNRDSDQLQITLDRLEPSDWYAFTLAPGGKPQLHHVGVTKELSAQVRAWYVDLRNPKSDAEQLRRDGLALRRAVFDPVVAGSAAKHLFIVPEGELFRVSFAALPDAQHGYLIETGVNVHTLANEVDLGIAPLALEAPQMLLAGAPDFPATEPVAGGGDASARQLCLRASREGFAAIPNAGRELDDLGALLGAGERAERVHVVRGAQATKQAVLAALPQANVIHLATHGFSLDESCAEDSSRGVTLQHTGDDTAQNGALSGLAFSGAKVSSGMAPVGVLSAGELATLDLSQVSWIALSACDSGLGPIGRSEGVFGMRRALRLAGARTVVMSLWQVDDAATADLMGALYRARFGAHADVPDAMRTAMVSVIDARRAAGQSDHPYYWAAFIGEGGWR